MTVAHLMLAALLGMGPGPDPIELVAKLGSPRYAEREAASEALQKLGRDALVALRLARQAKDPEVRSRVAGLIERIESDLMVKPTLVKLEFQDRPLAEVVQVVSDQSRISLNLVPENNPLWKSRRVTLMQPEPVSFWKALEALCRAGQLQYNPSAPVMMGFGGMPQVAARGPVMNLFPSSGALPPYSDNGPFRTSLISITHHRERTFGQSNAMMFVPGAGGMAPVVQPGQVAAPSQVIGAASEQFFVVLQFLAEPRMQIAQSGALTVRDVIDDHGQSLLLPSPSNGQFQRFAGYNGFPNMGGIGPIQLQVNLRFPEKAPQVIKRMRGTLPLSVSARKDDPMIVSLADSKGKTFRNGEISLVIHEVKSEANFAQTTIDLTVKSQAAAPGLGQPAFAPEFMIFRNPGNPQAQLEIVDAQGKSYPQWFTTNQIPGTDGMRATLRLMATDGVGPPTQIRYYEMSRATTEAAFEFNDIPLP